MLSLAQARANKAKLEYAPVKPKFIGRRVFKNVDLATIARYIDWGPFFQTWDLAGPYPAILTGRGGRRSRDEGVRGRPGDAQEDRRRPLADAPTA